MLLWPRRDQDVANCVRGRGDVEQDKEPSQQQAAPAEVPETGTTRMREMVLTRSRKKESHVAGEQLRRSCNAGTGDAVLWCLRLQGDDSVDPREISSELLVQRGGRLPPQHAPPGKQSRRRQDQRYRVAVVVFATMLQFCRLPARSAVDSLAEGEERDAEELG
ncbi:hypothetical protein NDU88_003081 [Pleurodeles waltl]|uniref:Uncharacterized protein n=1 Tax=Pleurodeles waltl TaxID=8319 RepID=A0AAV7RCV9_PLEWA|nr:hypothetical protein NDU88_003081 [Pleurodeles waltl]